MRKFTLFLILCCLINVAGWAQHLKPASIFTDNMVLQQQARVAVWGISKPGEKVTVITSWDNRKQEAVTDKKGNWKMVINTPEASFTPYEVTILSGSQRYVLKNVLIGEVWIASGQSNMSMPMKGYTGQPVEGATKAILESRGKQIRFINIPALGAYRPVDTFDAQWQIASASTVGDCTAVGWFFADLLYLNLNVPVGIINASVGGANIEAWMTPEACMMVDGIDVPAPCDVKDEWLNNVPTVLYNGMLHPIWGYGIRGVIWYQGESNVFDVPRYVPSMVALVKEWRRLWGCGNFPFYFAQIAPYDYKEWNFFKPRWAEISAYQREAQGKCVSLIPNSAMAVLMDVGEEFLIHPRRKQEVGFRLGLLALQKTYGMKGFEAESPIYEKMEIKGDKAIIHFSNLYNGITSYGKKLELFEMAGENRVFHKAEAYIDSTNSTIVVSCKYIKEPKAVRYAFKDYVQGELFGVGGLPVSSFRTDDWE